MSKHRNPFLVALVAIAVSAAGLALVLAVVSAGQSGDPISAAITSAASGLFAQLAVAATLVALLAGALTWRPGPRQDPAASTGDVDTTGMTAAERRFFTDEGGAPLQP